MERLTKKTEDGKIFADDNSTVLERLAKFEDLYEYVTEQQKSIPMELEALRKADKTKSYKYRELFGHKLMNDSFISLFNRFELK
jgi:hypothetical protein